MTVANDVTKTLKDLKVKIEEFRIKEEYLERRFQETKEREYEIARNSAAKLKDAFSGLVQGYEKDTKNIWTPEMLEDEVATAYRSYSKDIQLLGRYNVKQVKAEEQKVDATKVGSVYDRVEDSDYATADETGCGPAPKAVDSATQKHLKNVNDKLDALRAKAIYFDKEYAVTKKEKYKKASDAAHKLIRTLQTAVNAYEKDLDLDKFKKRVKAVFEKDCAEEIKKLETHRGWKQVLVNTLAFILSLGVGYLAAAAYKGSWAVFKPATDSANKVQSIAKAVDELKELEKDNDDHYSPYSRCGAYQ